MSNKSKLIGAVAGATLALGAQTVLAGGHQEMTVAYFLEWPMPFEYAKQMGTYDEELGVKVNWVSFDSGVKMSAAMASGDVHLSVSQGVPPFVVATSAGQDLQILDVAVSYADNDNCVVRSDLEIDKSSTEELAGKKVAVPLGTAAHYGFLKQMDHFGVDVGSMEIVDMDPPDGAAAIAQGAVDMFCGWGGSLRRAKEHGNILLTGAEKTELGILVFDDNYTPFDKTDDQVKLLTPSEGNGNLPSATILSIAEDKDGEIWVGTETGLAIYYNPSLVFAKLFWSCSLSSSSSGAADTGSAWVAISTTGSGLGSGV